ncbi:MAG: glutamate--tRNA ligase [Planctomycetota bacterium]|nr:glutamate--tRNA ligase [Planctomycetota bacterium]
MSDPVRVRFAPSPTGQLHIGGARTALFNWAFARHRGGAFVLRIEDTDSERSKPEFEAAILDGLRWLGIDWDEGPDVGGEHGPYRQSERAERYLGTASALFKAGWAYRCFCEPARLTELREGQVAAGETPRYDRRCKRLSDEEAGGRVASGERPVLRFAVPEGETRFADHVRGEVVIQHDEVDDWIMVRSDGTSTYNFSVVVDDSDMEITHVLRAEEHIVNTPKQLLLYRALGLEAPEYAHLPLMLGQDKKKLSKRSGDTAVQEYRDKGYPPEAVVNFLSLQGWALDGSTEVFPVSEMLARFDLSHVGKAGAIFDPEKFLWMAGEYVRMDDVERLAERCAPFVVAAGLFAADEIAAGGARRDWYLDVVRMEQERIRLYSELPGRMAFLFAADDAVEYDEKALKNARKHAGFERTLADYLEWLRPRIETGVDVGALRDATRDWVKAREIKFPALFQPLRCALTGEAGGPDLFDVLALLGSERARARIEAGIERLRPS